MTTIRDVARKASVSVATVSRVLNGSSKVSQKSKDAVLAAQKELGFYLNANARALAQRDSHTIGIVVSDVSDPYFGAMIRACDDAIIDDLISYQCRGLIVHALALDEPTLRSYLDTVPYMVLVNRVVKGYESRCLNCDNYQGERMAVDELIAHGHRKIAYINSCHPILDTQERLQGYFDSLHAHNIETDPRLVTSGEPSLEGGASAAHKLLENLKPGVDFTAVACYSDVMAAGLMGVFHHHGINIPNDISITGFDNLFLSRCLIPALTTVDNPVKLIAEEAIARSLALYEGQEVAAPHRIDVSLITRDSVRDLTVPVHPEFIPII